MGVETLLRPRVVLHTFIEQLGFHAIRTGSTKPSKTDLEASDGLIERQNQVGCFPLAGAPPHELGRASNEVG